MSLLTVLQDAVRRSPADETEIRVRDQHEALTRFGDGAITQNVAKHGEEVVVRVRRGGREGTARVNALDRLDQAIAAALQAAECQHDGSLLPLVSDQLATPEVHSYDQATAELAAEVRAQGALAAIQACRAAGARASGSYAVRHGRSAYVNQHGVAHQAPLSLARFAVTAEKGQGSGWATQAAVQAHRLDLPRVTGSALDKCLTSQEPRPLAPGTYPVLLEAAAVADLMFYLNVLGFGALRYLEGRHFATGRLGDAFFDERLNVADDVTCTGGLPFDDEGLPRQRVQLVSKGRLTGLVHDRNTAQRMGVAPTGHGLGQPNTSGPLAQNLVVAGGDRPFDALLAGMERGVLVTQLHYINVVDPMTLRLTGLTRNGTFWVEDGRIRHPVENLRFTDSLLDCLMRAEPSREQSLASAFWGGWIQAPSLLLDRFHFSSAAGF